MGSAIYKLGTGIIECVHFGLAKNTSVEAYGRDPNKFGILTGVSDKDLRETAKILIKDGKITKRCLLRVTVNGKRWDEVTPCPVPGDGKSVVTVNIQKLNSNGAPTIGEEMLDLFPDHPRVLPITPDNDKVKLVGGKTSFAVGPYKGAAETAVLVFDEPKVMIPGNVHVKFKI